MAEIKKQRIWEIDALRGFVVLCMVFDHLMYSSGFIFYPQWFSDGGSGFLYELCYFGGQVYWPSLFRACFRMFIVLSFIILCGISLSFSRSNFKRGLKILAVAMGITIVTSSMDWLFNYQNFYTIRFGVLHMLAFCVLIHQILPQPKQKTALIGGIILIALGAYFYFNPLPGTNLAAYIIGLNSNGYSADYYPLLPWVGYFLLGSAWSYSLYKQKKSHFPNHGSGAIAGFLQKTGRHALLIYVLHQALIYLIFSLIGIIFKLN